MRQQATASCRCMHRFLQQKRNSALYKKEHSQDSGTDIVTEKDGIVSRRKKEE